MPSERQTLEVGSEAFWIQFFFEHDRLHTRVSHDMILFVRLVVIPEDAHNANSFNPIMV